MPYIKQEDRKLIDEAMEYARGSTTPGELNYSLTQLCLGYVYAMHESYSTYNSIIGALECCKQEFYRKLISKYEDEKCVENGEIYPTTTEFTGYKRPKEAYLRELNE